MPTRNSLLGAHLYRGSEVRLTAKRRSPITPTFGSIPRCPTLQPRAPLRGYFHTSCTIAAIRPPCFCCPFPALNHAPASTRRLGEADKKPPGWRLLELVFFY